MNLIDFLLIILLSMLPFWEARYTIPFIIAKYKVNIFLISIAILANFVPVPFILKFLEPIEKWLRKWRFWDNLLNKIFEHTRKKTKRSIEKWESLALIVFVAIPLPVTGAWTASLAAYLFGLDFKKSLICIFIGICIASIIISIASITGIRLLK